jgi:hypothetical protein
LFCFFIAPILSSVKHSHWVFLGTVLN